MDVYVATMSRKRKKLQVQIDPWFEYSDYSSDGLENASSRIFSPQSVPQALDEQLEDNEEQLETERNQPAPDNDPQALDEQMEDNEEVVQEELEDQTDLNDHADINDLNDHADLNELEEDYFKLLNSFSEAWLILELKHKISKTAANEFWRLAISQLPNLLSAKQGQNVTRKIPQFQQIRRTLYSKHLPKINLEVAYLNTESGEIETQSSANVPTKMFPSPAYTPLYEVATVQVII